MGSLSVTSTEPYQAGNECLAAPSLPFSPSWVIRTSHRFASTRKEPPMKQTYHGSCHCKAITYEVAIDISQGTGKCNCTYCWKMRNWSAQVQPGDFRLLTGAELLGDYSKSG